MIINISRTKTFSLCKRKALNLYHRGVEGSRSMNLVDGGAFHRGVAVGRATKNWQKARAEAKILFDQDVAKSAIPEEQIYLIEEHWQLVDKMLGCFEEQYEHEQYQIIQPECEFDVELPDSMHSCIMVHWFDLEENVAKWGKPPADKILRHAVRTPHEFDLFDDIIKCPCWQPHRLTGKTDGIVLWNSNVWLDEYKTTSITGDMFWDQWNMDIQPTGYIYGVQKALKIRPRGFFLHAIVKPSEAQVANWNSKRKYGPQKTQADYIKYERQAFLRTEDDLARVERYILQVAQDWEEEVQSGSYRMKNRVPFMYNPSSHSCNSYNRKCDYITACISHEKEGEFDVMVPRKPDYVDDKLVQLQGVKR